MVMGEHWHEVSSNTNYRKSLGRDIVIKVGTSSKGSGRQRRTKSIHIQYNQAFCLLFPFAFPPVLVHLEGSLDEDTICSELLRGHSMSMRSSSVGRPLLVTLNDMKASSGAAC